MIVIMIVIDFFRGLKLCVMQRIHHVYHHESNHVNLHLIRIFLHNRGRGNTAGASNTCAYMYRREYEFFPIQNTGVMDSDP